LSSYIPHKPAITRVPIHDLIAQRWSPVAFDAQRPVSRAQLIALLEAARWAPSCFGDQPWRYIVWDRFTDAAAWEQAQSCLTPGNQNWAHNPPILMLSLAGSVFSANGNPNRWAQHDTGAASENICLQATALGLMAHQMGGFDVDQARTLFGIPADYTPMAMIAVGYQSTSEGLNDKLRQREAAARARRPLEEMFFADVWGRALEVG
jgi:nitroreductase